MPIPTRITDFPAPAVNDVGDRALGSAVSARLSAAVAQRSRRPRVSRGMAARVIWLWLALGLGAGAAAADAGFAWHAPPGCPDADEVRRRVEHRHGAPLEGAVHGIEIAIARDRGGFVATIDARALTVANDVRTLRAPRCDALADAIAVIVARLASEVRGSDRARAVTAFDRDRDDRPPPFAVAPMGVRVRSSVPARPGGVPPWGGGARVLAVSGVGALPRVNLGGELAIYVRRQAAFVELAAARWMPQAAPLEVTNPPVTLDIATMRAGWRPEHVPLRAWLAGELGAVRGAGMASADRGAPTGRWAALGAGFGVAWSMAVHARLVGTIEIAVPIERGRYWVEHGAELYRPSAAAARCAFGLEVGWP